MKFTDFKKALLVWRLWKVDQSNRQLQIHSNTSATHSKLREIIRIIVESGFLYTAAALTSFVTFVVGSNAVYVATDVVRDPRRLIVDNCQTSYLLTGNSNRRHCLQSDHNPSLNFSETDCTFLCGFRRV